jgi:small-conductance mechanosensitive channel
MMDTFWSVFEPLKNFWQQLSLVFPKILAAALLVILGGFVAKYVRKLSIRLLRIMRLDIAAEKSGLEDFLIRGGVKFTTVTLLGNMIYWLIIFVVLLGALNILGLEVAADLFNKIILYIPNVLIAMIVLIFGMMFAKFVQGVTFTYLSNIKIDGAELISVMARYAILLFVMSMALEQLAIGGQILVSAFQIAFGALCLALALAFGLGGRDRAAKILDNMWKK